MSNEFREFLKKVGSGTHTGRDLNRQGMQVAMGMMLQQEATPAQIGAFMIAHRIKRPTPEELAGMLDAYDELGPVLPSLATATQPEWQNRVTVLSCPYDGRSRTAPVTPITALILAAAGVPVLMHGGDRMPTKYGTPLTEIWQGLGVDWTRLSLDETQKMLATTGLGFVYLPKHFPQAADLVPYRDQIGKRPPIASLELVWSPYAGKTHLVAGFVHPPSEDRFRITLELRDRSCYTTVKGLEGSCDLPRSRTAIIGTFGSIAGDKPPEWERLHLHPEEYGLGGHDVPLESDEKLIEDLRAVIEGKSIELTKSAIWNGGFYLWRCEVCPTLKLGIEKAEMFLKENVVAQKLKEVIHC
ncbi:anthranilate phosphoribosyltransferase family protein [Oscillatoriales cyanobacterium LEGE 11467]|uniref:Anthranilate phosphoribosyltransferase family protein n=1 Tax=Zarconia navalis LEGE 11467 TaxID=1828826 RepID=A0A928VZT1_9CYAN|nr:anthranilate phosphoribosyltransferase family protein [Zarconia navalis]MBE9041233.1 anthranilate phosphoribosyltransferase family protein [Zarconia navalis LEGE 11467]